MSALTAPMRIVVLGGGSGIPNVLAGLADLVRSGAPLSITAIVATADDGGSSGRIRRERGGVPPGDLRNCLMALADGADEEFGSLFAHRYDGAGDLAGHSLGNLVLMALAEREGCWLKAVDAAGRLLRTRGRVLPVTPTGLKLEGETVRGERISGESRIGAAPTAIRRVWLEPERPAPSPGVVEALVSADLVIMGPGSLFTSLLAVLLVEGVADAARAAHGPRVVVGNLMTQPGETLGLSMAGHLEAIDRHVGPGLVDVLLLNDAPIAPERLRPYADQSAELVDPAGLSRRPETLHAAPLVNESGKIRHDPARLADTLVRLATPAARSDTGPSVAAFPGGRLSR
jgi:uncharacterized cofD-like protein